MTDPAKMTQIVRSVLERQFAALEIIAVNVRPDVDADGDEVALINIVFDDKKSRLNPGATVSLIGQLRPEFAVAGERAFPIISFIAKSELGKLNPEAA